MNKHPSGLSILFLTEIWERFGFYIAQGLLVLYMTQQFGFTDNKSYNVLGAFTALAYIAPAAGGYLADRLLGFKKAIYLGGILLFIGYLTLALSTNNNSFYLALAIIVVGTGFLKPNISSLLGTLYPGENPHRNAGFTIFYVGIYVGVLLSTLIIGFIRIQFGWHISFALASGGMLIALLIFTSGKKILATHGNTPTKAQRKYISKIEINSITSLACISMVLIAWMAIQFHHFTHICFLMFGIALSMSLFKLIRPLSSKQRHNVALLLVLYVFSAIFWALYFQTFFSLTLFIQRDLDRVIGGIEIPTITFLAFIPTFIILFGPLFAKFWTRLKKQNNDFSLQTKFSWGLIFTGLSFLVISIGIHFSNAQGLTSPWWIMASYFFITVGELFISPIGLSMVTELAPAKLTGLLMGTWFFSLGLGGQLAGVIANWTNIPSDISSVFVQKTLYQQGFLIYALIGVSAGLLLLCGNYIYKKFESNALPTA